MSEPKLHWTNGGHSSVYGVALGIGFILVSTLLEIGMSDLPLSIAGALRAQVSQPLLWIVDTAPLVLGIFGSMIGHRERALREVRQDIAAERRLTAELVEAKETAESASRIKSEFLANMSHEIRTPMNGVLGMAKLIQGTDLSDQQRQFVEAIDESGQTLLSIINDLLDFSKIETDKLALREAPFPLSETLTTPLKAIALGAAEKGLELVYEEDEGLPRSLVGDQGRVCQIFLNLIENAVKFTEEGEVIVRLSLEELSDGDATIALTVRDTGIGVDDETMSRIFEAFSQGDGSHTRRFGGTGLGLTISSQLAGLMGGKLTVDSVAGEWSEFRAEVTLPVAPAGETLEAAVGLAGKRVLVVDDSASSRRALVEYLERWSIVAIPVESAMDALETARVMRAAGRPIDAVLADLKMPYPEDLPLFERLEKEPEFGRVKVIALLSGRNGNHVPSIPEDWMAARLDKPVFPEELAMALAESLREREEAVEGAGGIPGTTVEFTAARVLVAEDDRVNQMLAVGLLEKRGYTVTIAPDGAEALALCEQEEFDFVLMDVQMPVMDGLEATRRIRALEEGRLRRIPIIAVTAHSMKGDRERCLSAGMDDYVSKPIDPERLYAVIDRRFPDASNEFEPGRALDLLSGDKERLASAVRAFLEEAPAQLEAMHAAFEHLDAPALSKSAQSMEGRADRMAMPRLRDIAHRIAVLSGRGEFEEAAALMAELDAAVGSGTSAIKRSIDAA